jgi:AraC-like DNA-binding protein
MGQFGNEADSLIKEIFEKDPNYIQKDFDRLIFFMYVSDFDSSKLLSDKLLEISPLLKNKLLYISTLIHSYRFYPYAEKIKLLNKAVETSIKEKNYYFLGAAYKFKSMAFRDASVTDSAMIYALSAKDIFIRHNLLEEFNGINELIGSMHYYAGQYDEAEKLFREILENAKVKRNGVNYVVMNNNLGLIRIKQNRFEEAENYFLNSISYFKSIKMLHSDTLGLAYIYRKLLDISIKQNKFKKAEEYFNLGKLFSERYKQTTELPGIYALKGILCFKTSQFDSALYYFNLAQDLESKDPDIHTELIIYEGLSKTYNELHDYKNGNYYMTLLLETKNRADSIFYQARYMNTFAEHNYNEYKGEIENLKKQQILLYIILSIITLSLFSITYLFVKLRRSNIKLVSKSIEAANINIKGKPHLIAENIYSEETEEPNNDKFEDDLDAEEINYIDNKELDNDRIEQIVSELENLVINEKIHLDPGTNIKDIANKLKTNRTYLSKAINSVYKINFSTYINNYRIKEAIRIITEGENNNLNLNGIAQLSGFNNRISFAQAFQKYTGLTPSFFMKNVDK